MSRDVLSRKRLVDEEKKEEMRLDAKSSAENRASRRVMSSHKSGDYK